MNRFKIICIGIALLIAMSFLCSCEPLKDKYPGYEMEKVYDHPHNSMAIYKIKTPSMTYTVLRDQNGGMIILK